MRTTTLLLGLLLVAAALARPHHGERTHHRRQHRRQANAVAVNDNNCASRCAGANDKFRYAAGKSYSYDYSATTSVALPGVPGAEETELKQTATATFSVLSKCELSLKLSDVRLEGGSESGAWKAELESRPLRFSFDDGVVREICPTADEPAWAVNIKRGIISAFQNALEGARTDNTVYESDVSGLCPTEYTRSEERGADIYRRTKNLIECTNHHGNYSALRGVPYTMKSKVQNTPLMKSEQECTHSIKNHILQKAECTETHSFNPLNANQEEGIKAVTVQKLEFKSDGKALPCCTAAQSGPRASLNFDHSEYEFEQSAEAKDAARANIRELCRTSQGDVRPETPGLFTELIYNLRKMSEGDLKKLHSESKAGKECAKQAKFFHDAVPMCATESCLKLMVDIVKSGSLGDVEQSAWIMSLALVPRPTQEMVKVVTGLVEKIPDQGLLGVSSLVHGFCRQNPFCAEVPEVETFVQKLLSLLGNKCSGPNEERIILALKAIGNVGHVQSAVAKLVECGAQKSNSAAVRVAAIQALRRMPCSAQLETPLMERTSDVAEDVEIRLTAFLGLIRCPSPAIVRSLVLMLDDEPVNQVSSFIYSYLKAKQRTGSPQGTEISRQLRKHSLHRRFARDPLRFSNFYEIGQIMEAMNMGAHIEEATIFVPKSSLPRQAFANLTMHLFGTSVNLLEVGGRFEGMDHALSQLFGPSGYLSNPDAYYFTDADAGSDNNRVRKFQDMWTQRRPRQDKVSISAYMRIFGDELATYTYQDPKIVDSVKDLMNTEKFMSALEQLSQLDITKNVMFMDSVLTVPTVSGIPLRLAVNGTASLNVEVKTKADLKSLMRPPHNMELMGHVKPSAAVEIAASLAMDTNGLKSGARFVTRIHTSTNIKASIQLKDGKMLKTKVELPQDKMEIIDVHSQLFSVRRNVETVEAGVPGALSQGRKHCSPSALNRITGLKVCGEMQMPGRMDRVPFVPLSGPLRSRLTVEKDDATLRSYELTAEFSNEGKRVAKFSFDTPGSTVDRNIVTELEMKPGQEVKAMLKYPGKELSATGSLERAGNAHTGRLVLSVDKKEEYSAASTITIGQNGKYSVDSEIVRPNESPVKMTGELSTQMPRLALEAEVTNLYQTPVVFKAAMEAKKNKYESMVELKTPGLNVDVAYDGEMEGSYGKGLKAQLRVSHKRPEDAQAHVATMAFNNKVTQKDAEYKLESSNSFESNWYSQWNSDVTYSFHSKSDLIQTRLETKYGQTTCELSQVTRITDTDKYTTELSAVSARHHLNHKAVVVYQNRFPERFLASADIDTPRMSGVKAKVSMLNKDQDGLDMESEASIEYPGRKVELKHTLKEAGPQEYKSDARFSWAPNSDARLVSDLKLKSRPGQYEYEMDSEATLNTDSKRTFNIHKRFVLNNKESVYQGFLKTGGKSLYDFKLNVVEESPKKTLVRSHIRSEAANVDFDIEGEMEEHKKTSKARVTLKKDRKEYLKGELIYPSKSDKSGEKQLKGAVDWDLDAGNAKKHLSAEYILTAPAADQRTHSLIAKADLGDGPAYDLNVRVHKSDHYALNITSNQGSEQILDFSTGLKKVGSYRNPSELAFDMGWKSGAPLPVRSYQLLLTHKQNAKDFASTGYVEDLVADQKLSFDADYKQVKGRMVQYKLSLGSKGRRFSLDEEMDFDDLYDFSSVKAGKTGLKAEWDGRTSSYKSEWQIRNRVFTYKTDIATPFDSMKTAKVEAELSMEKLRVESNWNTNKRVMIELECSSVKPDTADLSARLQTSFQDLKDLEARVKYAFKTKTELDAALMWGQGQKLRFYHSQDDKKFEVGVVSKVSQKDMEAKLSSELDVASGIYKAEAMYKNAPNMYKLSGTVDTKRETGNFELQTPSQELRSAAVSVKKTAEGEWTVESDRNGEANLVVRSILKLKDGDHRVKLQVERISSPFAVEYEGKFSDKKWRLKTELTRNPSDATPIVYGLHLSDEATGPKDRVIDVRVRHPSRQMKGKITAHSNLPDKYSVSAEITPNMAENRQPTKIHAKYEKKSDRVCEAELRVEDPTLPKGLSAVWKSEKSGQCNGNAPSCTIATHVKVAYSGNADKTLTLKSVLSREPMDPTERTFNGVTSLVTPVRMSIVLEAAHPATGLHAKVFGHHEVERCAESICRREVEAGVEFKDAQKQIKQMSLNAAFDAYQPSISVKLTSPDMRWSIRGQSGGSDGEYRLSVSRDGDEVYAVIVRASDDDKTLLLEVKGLRNNEEEVLLHASARLVNKDMAQIRLWHTESGKRIEDGEVSVRLDKADLLNTKFYLRPGLDRELQFAAQEARKQMGAAGRDSSSSSDLAAAWRTVTDSHRAMSDEMYGATEPLLSHWAAQRGAFTTEFGPAIEEALDVLTLYYEIIRELTLATMDVIEQTMDQIVDTIPSRGAVDAYYQTKEALSDIPATLSGLVRPFSAAGTALADAAAGLSDSIAAIKDNLSSSLNLPAIKRQMEEIYEEVKDYPVISQLIEWILAIKDSAPDMRMGDVKKTIKGYYHKAGKSAQDSADSMQKYWEQWEGTIVEYELGRALVAWAKEALKSMRMTYDYVAPEDRIDDVFRWIREQFHAYKNEKMGWNAYVPRVVKADVEEGQYEIEIPLPMKARSLEHVASAFHPDSFVALKNRMSEELGRVSNTLGDAVGAAPNNRNELNEKFQNVLHTIQGYQATQFAKSWPFESKALLIGDEHFVTFDGRVFAFKADCEYLLAHDFVDQRFTLRAKFGREGNAVVLSSVTLRAQGHSVTLSRDGRVLVDGANTALPWQKQDELSGSVQLAVSRWDHSTSVTTKDSIRVRCDWYYSKCSISLPGHYHGKSAGLLGSNDNEQNNDWEMPDGSLATSADDFASSWHVGSANCANVRAVASAPRTSEDEKCNEFFSDNSSPFAACFRHINPAPFDNMCNMGDDGACKYAAAYTTVCRWAGIPLDMPSECVKCETPAGTLDEGTDAQIEADQSPAGAVDVVFVVEELPCNSDRMAQIPQLAEKVKASLGAKGLSNVRFGVIGFGGEGVHAPPHFHSGNDKVNFDINGLKQAAATLDFNSLELVSEECEKAEPMQAMKFIADYYPFRPAVRKVAVLVSCSGCQGGRVGFYDLQNALLNNGITFHMLASEEIELSEGGHNGIVGMDASRLYNGRGEEAQRGSRDAVVAPHSSCSILAQETDGSVFSANSNNAVDAIAAVVAAKAEGPAECSVCECTTSCAAYATPLTKCYPCEIPSPVSLSGSGRSFFPIPYLDLKKPARRL